jgi:hypothetical protein
MNKQEKTAACTLTGGRFFAMLRLRSVDMKQAARIFGNFSAFLRCRRSEYIQYPDLIRLEMHENLLKYPRIPIISTDPRTAYC